MEGESGENKTVKEESSEAVKELSDAQVFEELEKRLLGKSSIEAAIAQRLQGLTVEIQKRIDAKSLRVEEEPKEVSPQVAEARPESLVETDGKKWADILREKSLGGLFGKFSDKWGYFKPDGTFCNIIQESDRIREELYGIRKGMYSISAGYMLAGLYRTGDKSEVEYARSIAHGQHDFIDTEVIKNVPSRANFLLIEAFKWKDENGAVSDGRRFSYYAWLNPRTTPDSRGYHIPLRFAFATASKEGNLLETALREKADLIEDVFQNMYPGLTGENGAQRMIVNNLVLEDRTLSKPTSKTLPFSHPVGETPFSQIRR